MSNLAFTTKFSQLSKDQLRNYYDWFVGGLTDRATELARHVKSTPGFESWRADSTPDSLKALGQWFAAHVKGRPRSEKEIKAISDQSPYPIEIPEEELTDVTFELCLAVAMYFSLVLIHEHPSLNWAHSMKSKASIDYGHPVLVGFGKAELNPLQVMTTLAYGVLSGKRDGAALHQIFCAWSKLAGASTAGPKRR